MIVDVGSRVSSFQVNTAEVKQGKMQWVGLDRIGILGI
jgi:hypothetical protein